MTRAGPIPPMAPARRPAYHPGRVRALLLAGLLLAVPAAVHAQDEGDFGADELDDEGRDGRLRLTAWGGEAWNTGASGRDHPILGGEASWAFDHLDVGVAGYGYRGLAREERDRWDPVLLVRITQRFETYRGFEAGLTLGAGGARRGDDWQSWFQLGLGVRLDLGPMFLAGEIAFEQNDLIHLTGGLGVKLF